MPRTITVEKSLEDIFVEYLNASETQLRSLTDMAYKNQTEVANLAKFTNDITQVGTELGKIMGATSLRLVTDSFKELDLHFSGKVRDLVALSNKIIETQNKQSQTLEAITNALLLVAKNQEELSDRCSDQNTRIERLEKALTFMFEAHQAAQQQSKK
ncbi:hypothetical protein NIES25_52350 [Nostoc linckia NIES-25]|nr:hypothetical protein NIES25_52350 [Nostoc linckia NIES-25]